MKIKRKIEVTAANIEKGVPCDMYVCPIALAINRTLRINNSHVGGDNVCFRFNDGEFNLDLPEKVVDWLEKFDAEMEVDPFTFVLRGGND